LLTYQNVSYNVDYRFAPYKPHNTTMCCRVKVTLRVTQLGWYVIVDVGGKSVTIHALNVCINVWKKKKNNSSRCELGPPVVIVYEMTKNHQ